MVIDSNPLSYNNQNSSTFITNISKQYPSFLFLWGLRIPIKQQWKIQT